MRLLISVAPLVRVTELESVTDEVTRQACEPVIWAPRPPVLEMMGVMGTLLPSTIGGGVYWIKASVDTNDVVVSTTGAYRAYLL